MPRSKSAALNKTQHQQLLKGWKCVGKTVSLVNGQVRRDWHSWKVSGCCVATRNEQRRPGLSKLVFPEMS